ncbi:MAG: hypothetical protein ACYDC1_20880 [Limisphaerales bacterium]
MKLELVLTITYQPNGATVEQLIRSLELTAEEMANGQRLSMGTAAEVTACTHEVRNLDVDDAPPAPESAYESDKRRIWDAFSAVAHTSAVTTETLGHVHDDLAEVRQDLNRFGDDLRTLTSRVDNLEANH